MANREFIAAKDLPVTEAEEVNVLVVDPATGELAQKAGANLGGGGGGLLVVNITLGNHEWDSPSSVTFDRTYEEIKDAMDKGCAVIGWVAQSQFNGEGEYQYCGGYLRPAFPIYGHPDGSAFISFFPTAPDHVSYYIRPDGETGYISD